MGSALEATRGDGSAVQWGGHCRKCSAVGGTLSRKQTVSNFCFRTKRLTDCEENGLQEPG